MDTPRKAASPRKIMSEIKRVSVGVKSGARALGAKSGTRAGGGTGADSPRGHGRGPSLVLLIAVPLLISVAATRWFIHWSAEPETHSEPVAASVPPPAATPSSPFTVSAAQDAPAPLPAPAAPKATGARALPIEVYFHRRAVHMDPAHRGQRIFLSEGRIVNLSADSLSVDVTVTNAATLATQQAAVYVPAHGEQDFGADDDLVMHPNDSVVLYSSGYGQMQAVAH
jgi:hypothetical protein